VIPWATRERIERSAKRASRVSTAKTKPRIG
jgi:hypothetical protein